MLFDLDGTLHDRQASLRRFIGRQYEQIAPLRTVPADVWEKRFMQVDAGGHVWKDRVYQTLVSEFNIPYSWEALLADYECSFRRSVVPFAGAADTLHELRNRGFLLGLLSNGRETFQRSVLSALVIEDLFNVVLISESEGVRKPEPEIFWRALRRLGVTAGESLFIGDSPEYDIAGAKNAGLYAVLKRTDNAVSLSDADGYITDLTELLSMPLLERVAD